MLYRGSRCIEALLLSQLSSLKIDVKFSKHPADRSYVYQMKETGNLNHILKSHKILCRLSQLSTGQLESLLEQHVPLKFI